MKADMSAYVVDFPTWLNTPDAARYLGITDATLKRLPVPSYRFGRVFRYKLSDLETFVEGCRVR
jgi:hypothetical protein